VNPHGDPGQESLRDLASGVLDDGKAYVRAELALVKQTALAKVQQAITPAILFVVAIFLLQAAITILAAALGYLLAIWLGLPGGFAVAALLVILLAGGLALLGARRIKDLLK
jgi:hypothetical protein